MFHPEGPTLRELAVQALSSTERGYDLLAPKFDHTPFRTPAAILDAVAAFLAPHAPFASGLDLCCGTGAGMAMLRPLCRDRVVGLDVSRVPFGPEFDVVVCFGATGHFLERDQPRLVAQAAGLLRPGGRLVFVTSWMPPPWSARYWLARGFNAAMHVRNLLVSPPFVMYYLTFLLPGVRGLLEEQGLAVEAWALADSGPLAHVWVVSGMRKFRPN
ncbi:MAG: class I SAM-dependent methyltransferase [Chloroflexi bacterium]|nr:MAG: class I SAM-dependent methyltransferase [Chloroflexota bacterium]